MKITFLFLTLLISSAVFSVEKESFSGVINIGKNFSCETTYKSRNDSSECFHRSLYDFYLNRKLYYIQLAFSPDNLIPICTFNILGMRPLPINANIRILKNTHGNVYLTFPQLKKEIPEGTKLNYSCKLTEI